MGMKCGTSHHDLHIPFLSQICLKGVNFRRNTLKGTGSSSTAMRCCTNGDGPLQRGEHVHGLEANPLSPIIAAY